MYVLFTLALNIPDIQYVAWNMEITPVVQVREETDERRKGKQMLC